jgi:hypothetical protein
MKFRNIRKQIKQKQKQKISGKKTSFRSNTIYMEITKLDFSLGMYCTTVLEYDCS